MTKPKNEEPSTETQEVIEQGGAGDPAQHDAELDAAAEAEQQEEPPVEEEEFGDLGEDLDEEDLLEAPSLPSEVKDALEAEYPVLREHGTHDAAMKGLQTDASGTYTPPGLLK